MQAKTFDFCWAASQAVLWRHLFSQDGREEGKYTLQNSFILQYCILKSIKLFWKKRERPMVLVSLIPPLWILQEKLKSRNFFLGRGKHLHKMFCYFLQCSIKLVETVNIMQKHCVSIHKVLMYLILRNGWPHNKMKTCIAYVLFKCSPTTSTSILHYVCTDEEMNGTLPKD